MQKRKYGIVIACALVISMIGLSSTGALSRSVALTDAEMSEVYGGTTCQECKNKLGECLTAPSGTGCYVIEVEGWFDQCLGWVVPDGCMQPGRTCQAGIGTCTETTTGCAGSYTILNCIWIGNILDRECLPNFLDPEYHACPGSKPWC